MIFLKGKLYFASQRFPLIYFVITSYSIHYTKLYENDIEEKLVVMWQEILGVKRVGIMDSFFDLGGHSLKATVLVSRIHKELNKSISLRMIFAHRITSYNVCYTKLLRFLAIIQDQHS